MTIIDTTGKAKRGVIMGFAYKKEICACSM